MGVESAADLAGFFAEAEFGTVATWKAGGTGAGVRVVGILDQPYAGPTLGDLSAESREITFRCRSVDVPTAQQGDTLTFAGATHRVRSVRPDGTGTLTLVLAAP